MRKVSPDQIRSQFSSAMSRMFRGEVPAYGTLVDLVKDINAQKLAADPELENALEQSDGIARISEERHGAIRLGTAEELHMMRRLFAVMGMHPVGYYDLSVAGIPVHSTAFRPLTAHALAVNPFRVFTSLLRLDLIDDEPLRAEAASLLSSRQIYTPRTVALIDKAEKNGGLNAQDADAFVSEALETFRWHSRARASHDMFEKLVSAHRLIADVVSFNGPHINHLTPRTLDIDQVQSAMPAHGINPKAVIEGPPPRQCPILLRQTSFKALTEAVYFQNGDDWKEGHHTARFGEIEQRGAALTPKGRALYDALLDKVRAEISPAPDGSNADEYMTTLARIFEKFPDDWKEMRAQGLAYFHYIKIKDGQADDIEVALEQGIVVLAPVIYEDFLPVSAAGIFQSNLGDNKGKEIVHNSNQSLFEHALGTVVQDEFAHYAQIEADSLKACLTALQSTPAQQTRAYNR